MGIGLVLIFWAVALTVVAVPVAAVLLGVAGATGGGARVKRILAWMAIAAPVAALYASWAFLAYAVWCSAARGVDPGLGDWWGVPLGDGFSLTFIDVTDHASIYPRHATDGLALIDDITDIGQEGHHVYGLLGPHGSFILDTRSGAVRRHRVDRLGEALREAGIDGEARTETVHRFYLARRWGWPDLAAAVVLGVPPLIPAGWTLRWAWRGRRAT